jgi:hypothetical protein
VLDRWDRLPVDAKTLPLEQSRDSKDFSPKTLSQTLLPKGGSRGLSDVERVVADLVRRANGEPPAW